jgi:putative transposase
MQRTPASRKLTNQAFFVTAALLDHAPVFAEARAAQIAFDTLQFFRSRREIDLHGYVIMPDHIHAIVNLRAPLMLPDFMRRFKSYVARQVGQGAIWQHGYWSQAVPNEQILVEKLTYMLRNPVRKRLVERPEDYEWSSAKDQSRDVPATVDMWGALIR